MNITQNNNIKEFENYLNSLGNHKLVQESDLIYIVVRKRKDKPFYMNFDRALSFGFEIRIMDVLKGKDVLIFAYTA